ncbi:cryptochrome/photolyase family protein [Microvirga rosea]|uniref:cryptochrome/photolyase family protein n=1 Tax=Microvirga rosea TaxID=2715425 RepID=UPI001D0B2539|nr:deoxyribodipyrimidine photo-lyase [Microvirga rosea]MCB8821038.1 DNA photolyase family protein [Microvirga rosea]
MGKSLPGPALVWFRDDYRLSDNPALTAAIATGAPILCFFILDESSQGIRPMGGAARWWLHGSLDALDRSLRALGAELILFRGPAEEIVDRIAATAAPSGVFWNRRYLAAEVAVDAAIKKALLEKNIDVRSFNGRLLHEPWEIKNQAGRPFQVFTPYLRAVSAQPVPAPLPAPKSMTPGHWPEALTRFAVALEDLSLEPKRPNWADGFGKHWSRGEAAARRNLGDFLETNLTGYGARRDIPALDGTSRLSPHLRFGELSPRQVWHAATARKDAREADTAKFLSEVIWRDFCHQQIFDNPDLADEPFSPRFKHFRWTHDRSLLDAWRKGLTGYPIVDAGMRQLWRTGWMHNRVRMIVGSFLVKHLLTDWREGESWFRDTLVDADPANNAFNWQWVAGSGPDSAPFHRIFNPITQGEKFDPEGAYVRRHLPELADLPASFIHKPWEAPRDVLRSAGIELGKSYPLPIIEHGQGRERALQAYRELCGKAE